MMIKYLKEVLMLQVELIEKANQALLVAEASGFEHTARALRLLISEVEQIPSLEMTEVSGVASYQGNVTN